jgi:hypothetical protein
MKVKHLKNKVVLESSKGDYTSLVKRINELDRIISTLHDINDMYLSDISTLEKLRYEVVDLLDLDWSSDNCRYVAEGENI